MSRLLIGSSNIYRFYKLLVHKEVNPYKMVCCTNQDVWNVAVDDIKFETGEVIISVIENLLCDALDGVMDPEVRKLMMEDVVGSFMAQVKATAQKYPGTKIALATPMMRPVHKWYEESYETLCGMYYNHIKSMGLQNVAKVDGSPGWSQVFEKDGIHLTEAAGKVFVEGLISGAEAFFNEEVVDLEKECDREEATNSEEANWVARRIAIVEKEIGQLNKELKNRESETDARRIQDSLVTARIREELDYISNAKKEDKIIITGLTSKTMMPTASEEKRMWLRKIVGDVLDKIVPDSTKHIIFCSLGNRNKRDIPLVEVKLDSRDLALKIRKEFSKKKKSENDFGRIFIANSVTLATRVRVDILKVIAKKHSTDREKLSVSAFVSRPVIHSRSGDGLTRLGTFNFSDSLVRFGANLVMAELEEAYKRAGAAFKGQLQQNFVVLRDQMATKTQTFGTGTGSNGNVLGSPRKRLREGMGNGKEASTSEKKTKQK